MHPKHDLGVKISTRWRSFNTVMNISLDVKFEVLQSPYATPTAAFPLMLRHGMNIATTAAIPAVAIEMIYVALSAAMYDTRIFGISCSGKVSLNPVAPAATTAAGLTRGASLGSWRSNVFVNADCAPDTKNDAPNV